MASPETPPPRRRHARTLLRRHVLRGALHETRERAGLGGGDVRLPRVRLRARTRRSSPTLLAGDENAIFDFRYTGAPKLTWYFDHHATAFASTEERGDFDDDGVTQNFHDPHYGSCTKLIDDVSRDKFEPPIPDPHRARALGRHHRCRSIPSAEMAVIAPTRRCG